MAIILEKCCLCIDLKIGSYIIGYMKLISNILLISLAIYVICYDANIELGIFITIIILFIISIIFNIFLIVGINRNNSTCIKYYMLNEFIRIVCLIIITLINVSNFDEFNDEFIMNNIMSMISIIQDIYFLLVIRSYYFKLK
jgi:hypothetical protein